MRTATLFLLVLVLTPTAALAHGDGHHNLRVLSKDLHHNLDRGMKQLSKGVGVKCTACHVKGEWAKDDKPAKVAARAFLRAMLRDDSAEARKIALRGMLQALERESVADESKLAGAMKTFRSRPHAR